jgi:hypothetical protein
VVLIQWDVLRLAVDGGAAGKHNLRWPQPEKRVSGGAERRENGAITTAEQEKLRMRACVCVCARVGE